MLHFRVRIDGQDRIDYVRYIDEDKLPYEGFVRQEMDAALRHVSSLLAHELLSISIEPEEPEALDEPEAPAASAAPNAPAEPIEPVRQMEPEAPIGPTEPPSEAESAESIEPDIWPFSKRDIRASFGPPRRPRGFPDTKNQSLRSDLAREIHYQADIDLSIHPGASTLAQALQSAGPSLFPTRVAYLNAQNGNRKFSELYNSVGVSKQTFSNLMSYDVDKGADRENVLRIAFAVKAGLEDAELLLRLKGFAFRPNAREDIVLRHCFERRIHNPFLVNEMLEEFECKPLFWST